MGASWRVRMPCTRGRRFRDDLVWSLAAGYCDRPSARSQRTRDAARLVPPARLAEAIRVGNASRASHGSP